MFDKPREHEYDQLPWGKVGFRISFVAYGEDPSFEAYINIDFRDYNWSGTATYPGNDLHLTVFSGDSLYEARIEVYGSGSSAPHRFVYNNENIGYNVWDIWDTNMQPNIYPFKYPVTLKNRVEGQSFDFGFLKKGTETINSGDYGLFSHISQNTITHGTLEENFNSERNYSFKWNHSSNVDVEESSNTFLNYLSFEIGNEVATKDITREFKPVYPLTIKNVLPENGSISAD